MKKKRIKMKKISSWILGFLAFGYVACDDVLEDDITDDVITIVSPQEGSTIESNITQFRWNSLEGADDYRLQVSGPSQRIILDTLISKTLFDYELVPGTYSWRVRGENFAYTTAYSFPVEFHVAQTEDLSGQTVILESPASAFYTNNPGITFQWAGIEVADTYTFQLIRKISTEEEVYAQAGISETSHTIPTEILNLDAQYIWKVKAVNSTSQSNFSNRIFYLDRDIPGKPVLTSPENNKVLTGDVDFIWEELTDTGTVKSEITYTLEISKNTDFSTLVETYNLTGTQQTHSFAETGEYYWRVKAGDKSGNEGAYSDSFKLTVN